MQKMEIMATSNYKADVIKGGLVILIPFVVIICLPWFWLRLLTTVVLVSIFTAISYRHWGEYHTVVYSDECCNQKIFGDKPLDCKIRRDDDGTETIDDLDFPNSRK